MVVSDACVGWTPVWEAQQHDAHGMACSSRGSHHVLRDTHKHRQARIMQHRYQHRYQHMATLTLLPCTPSSAAHTRPHKAAQHRIRCQRGATPYLLCSPRPICGALCSLPPSCRPCSSALVDTPHCAGSTPQPRHCTLPLALDACLASGEAQHP